MMDFPGVRMTMTDEVCILTSYRALLSLSSAVVGGGLQPTRLILNRHVPRNYMCDQPVLDFYKFAERLQITEPFVGLMTGVPMHGTRIVTLRSVDITITAMITAGVGNALTAGVSEPVPFIPGTINIVVLVDAHLAAAALVNAIITATEAKAATLSACSIISSVGELATGTSTDAVVIACTGRGPAMPYAGPGTEIGYLIARSVRECLLQALEPCSMVSPASVKMQ
jgi:iron complex transport system ATP-binding protein